MRRNRSWMPMYWGDLLRDTLHLNTAEFGAYVLLIGAYWCHGGPIPDDTRQLSRICRCTTKQWPKLSRNLFPFFSKVDGVLIHKRLEFELLKYKLRVRQSDLIFSQTRKRPEIHTLRSNHQIDESVEFQRVSSNTAVDPSRARPFNKKKDTKSTKKQDLHPPQETDVSFEPESGTFSPDEELQTRHVFSPDLFQSVPFPAPIEMGPPMPKPVDQAALSKAEIESGFDAYNAMAVAHGLAQCVARTTKRRTSMRLRLAEAGGLAGFTAIVGLIPQSPFLLGENDTGFKMTIDTLLRPERFAKLAEGGYPSGTISRTDMAEKWLKDQQS